MHAIVFFLCGLLGGCVRMQRSGLAWSRANVADALLLHVTFWSLGIGGLFSFTGHVFASDLVAGYVGWPAGNPFQLEVGFANLGLGLAGLLAFRHPERGFRLALGIVASAFLAGAGGVHLADLRATGNLQPGNFGPVLWLDFLLPLVYWGLFAFSGRDPPEPGSDRHA